MSNGVDRARDRRNILERLGSMIPGFKGFFEREMRREVDKMERDWMAGQVDRTRQALQGKIRDWSRGAVLDNLDLASSLDKLLDRFGNRIRHADYGYTGFFDAVKVYEAELEKLYQFDLSVCEQVKFLAERVAALPDTAAEQELRDLLRVAEEVDRTFDQRAHIFEDVTQKGGR